jgi:DNA-binding beta-propeller fold protein YncE
MNMKTINLTEEYGIEFYSNTDGDYWQKQSILTVELDENKDGIAIDPDGARIPLENIYEKHDEKYLQVDWETVYWEN